MNLAIQTTTTRTWKEIKAHYLVAACGGALALAALAGVGTWQAVGSGSHGTVSTPQSSVAVFTARPDVNVTYYLVSSQAQADAVLQGAEDAANIRAMAGDFQPRDQVEVLIAGDGASLALAMQGITDANNIRFQVGLPEMKLVDLRAPVQ